MEITGCEGYMLCVGGCTDTCEVGLLLVLLCGRFVAYVCVVRCVVVPSASVVACGVVFCASSNFMSGRSHCALLQCVCVLLCVYVCASGALLRACVARVCGGLSACIVHVCLVVRSVACAAKLLLLMLLI